MKFRDVNKTLVAVLKVSVSEKAREADSLLPEVVAASHGSTSISR